MIQFSLPGRTRAACACALFALAAGSSHAAPATSVPAADPQAAVPAASYEPAVSYQVAPAPDTAPDRTWLSSNQAVARKTSATPAAPGHADHGDDADHAEHADHAASQCMAGGGNGCSCCGGMPDPAHAGHGAMSMPPAADAAPRQCKPGAGCACCARMGATTHRPGGGA